MSEMIDINKEMNEIILKYQLDRHYPRFRKKLFGEKVLRKWAKEIDNNRILCVGTDQEDINYFSHLFYNLGKEFSYCLCFEKKINEKEKYDCIAVISKKQKDGMITWCEKSGIPVIFLYDYLELQGIYCEDDLYKIVETDYSGVFDNSFPAKKGWKEIILMEFYVQREKLALSNHKAYQRHYIEKLFFLSLYMRNFIQAETYQKQLTQLGDLSSKAAWDEIQEFLRKIKNILHSRSQTDIIMVWMDAVSYGTGEDIKYLQKEIKKGISFENAFTVTPHTNPTAQTLFLGKKLIDDSLFLERKITVECSPVLLDLNEHEYAYKVISGYLSIFDKKLQSPNYHELYAPCSVIFWDMLYNLLAANSPIYLLVHSLMEGHAPYLSTRMGKEDFDSMSSMLHKGHLDLDEQMEFYMDFLGPDTMHILMSDHGQVQVREQFHTYFVITGKKICKRKETALFSYVDFPKLIHRILEGDTLKNPLEGRIYAEIQMLDRYNAQVIGNIIKNKNPILLNNFGYFGVITKDYLYLKYHIGKEYLAQWDCMEFEPHLLYQSNDVCDHSLLPYFRKIIGDRTMDINKNEKFQYTHYLYKIYENFLNRRKKVFALVNQLFEGYPEQSIALRMGGAHSLELFSILTDENQLKLAYIIDGNPDCKCRKLGIPVISPEEVLPREVKAVVLSSFDHLDELRKEIPVYWEESVIIDIYQFLKDCGICCDNNFYAVNYMTDEDYDVGFPVEEDER